MKVLLIDNGTTLLEKLKMLIPGEEVVHTWKDFTENDIDQADIVILSGGSKMQLLGNEGEFEKELEFIMRHSKSLIGICFGSELITEAFGGTLKHLSEPHKGIREIELLDPELLDGKSSIQAYENHQWIIDRVPAEFEVIARSADGPEMIRHTSLPIWGIQCHPENYVDKTDGDELFLRLLNKFVA